MHSIIAEGKIIATTRWRWFHMNFGGWKGWRKIMEDGMKKYSGVSNLLILGRFFGHLVFVDYSYASLWKLPRYVKTTDDGLSTGFGWLYWAVYITKKTWYPNPRRNMPGFKDLPYASEALEAAYYLHDHQLNEKDAEKVTEEVTKLITELKEPIPVLVPEQPKLPQFSFEIYDPFITIPIENHIIKIDTSDDKIYFNGHEVDIRLGRGYNEEYCKDENKTPYKKRRALGVPTAEHAIVIDIGYDNRIFILYFTHEQYKIFRGTPIKQYSYWNNGKRKAFYEDDLTNAVWVKQIPPKCELLDTEAPIGEKCPSVNNQDGDICNKDCGFNEICWEKEVKQ